MIVMDSAELQARRKLLFLDVSEAAKFIGGVSNRSWQYFESGGRPVPEDIALKMIELTKKMQELMSRNPKYCTSFSEYTSLKPTTTAIDWRLNQSAFALNQLKKERE